MRTEFISSATGKKEVEAALDAMGSMHFAIVTVVRDRTASTHVVADVNTQGGVCTCCADFYRDDMTYVEVYEVTP